MPKRRETTNITLLTVLLLLLSFERRRRNKSSQYTACSQKRIWRAPHDCRHYSIPEVRKLKDTVKSWVLVGLVWLLNTGLYAEWQNISSAKKLKLQLEIKLKICTCIKHHKRSWLHRKASAILDKMNGTFRPPLCPLPISMMLKWRVLVFARLHQCFWGKGVNCSFLFCPRLWIGSTSVKEHANLTSDVYARQRKQKR